MLQPIISHHSKWLIKLEQLNSDGELYPNLANYWNADEEEYFNKWKTVAYSS